jgi:hypothetical protein
MLKQVQHDEFGLCPTTIHIGYRAARSDPDKKSAMMEHSFCPAPHPKLSAQLQYFLYFKHLLETLNQRPDRAAKAHGNLQLPKPSFSAGRDKCGRIGDKAATQTGANVD